MDDSTGGANAKEIEAMKELTVSLPVEFKAAADTWWEGFMDDEEMPKVGCKPVIPVEVATQKLVPVEVLEVVVKRSEIHSKVAASAQVM